MYVATMLGAATGYRSVRDPLNDRRHYDAISRRAIIADKTDDAHHGTRIAILPEILCQQLRRYEVHLRAMLPALALLNPMTHQKLKRLLMSTSGNDDMPFLFLLDETLKVKRMQPASVKPYLQLAGWSLPTNSNRHYLRTKLREAGATGEEVAIILGHWQYGQEPYSLFSTTGLDSIEARVEPMLTNLMAESGWEVMGGLE
jgi:hypothetical protein